MIGFNCSEAGHIVNVIPPIDGNAGAPVTAEAFSMKNWDHVSIIIQLGVTAAAPTSIVVKSAATSGGTGTAMPFRYYTQIAASGPSNDVMSSQNSALAAGITSVTALDNVLYVIEIDSAELPDGSPWVQLVITNPSSSILISAVAILSAGRHAFAGSPTVTA